MGEFEMLLVRFVVVASLCAGILVSAVACGTATYSGSRMVLEPAVPVDRSVKDGETVQGGS